ncbi:MAG: 50S ribosomal protein L15, partial [Anaeroplasmataceae bacterium]|nr:50S ribosomal protein L15 [Anaeroplasmataceae bacterium]
KTSGKGHKGQNARSGGGVRPGFEGGQLPLFQRLPKIGFHSHSHKFYAIVNIEKLNCFEDGATVDAESLIKAGLIKETLDGVKVLGQGELTKKLTVKVNKISKSAQSAIENAGGTVEVI